MLLLRDNISSRIGKLLSEYSTDTFAEEKITYLVSRFITNCIFLSLLFLIAQIIHFKLEVFVFLCVYLPLRRSFGGYHAKTEYACLFISVALPITASYIANKVNINYLVGIIVYMFSYATAFIKGVVDNSKKRLKPEQKIKFKKQGIILLLGVTFIHLFFVKDMVVSNIIIIALFVSFGNLYMKNN